MDLQKFSIWESQVENFDQNKYMRFTQKIKKTQNLETKGQCTLESLVRVAVILDLTEELGQLFTLKITSIALMEKIENWRSLPKRVRG